MCDNYAVVVPPRNFKILSSGTCPDRRNPWTYARSDQLVHFNGEDYITAIGGFAPGVGVVVGDNVNDFGLNHYGVAKSRKKFQMRT